MKPFVAAAPLYVLMGLMGPTFAETTAEQFGRCIAESPAKDNSAECVELRASYLAETQGCMLAMRDTSDGQAKPAGSGSAHAYKARYLTCTREVKAKYQP